MVLGLLLVALGDYKCTYQRGVLDAVHEVSVMCGCAVRLREARGDGGGGRQSRPIRRAVNVSPSDATVECAVLFVDCFLMYPNSGMLSSGANQYLRPEYLSPLPTTVSTGVRAFWISPVFWINL